MKGTLTIVDADALIITAKSYTISYGDEIPTFGYTCEGATVDGTPAISCTATSASPVGTYPITISKGSVSNYNDTYVNGTLTINKAPLTISAGIYTRKKGMENPQFILDYKGFKNGETEMVLAKMPTITSTATKTSPIGNYLVVISGASAHNYEITYENGMLTIELLHGDAISDGEVDDKDAKAVADFIMGNIPDEFDEDAADFNGDGYINVADIVAIINYLKENK